MHPAVRQARNVVGLYGDPRVTWSIALGVRLERPLRADEVADRAAAQWPQWPHLGSVPEIIRVAAGEWDQCRARFLDTPYGDDDPLVRVALTSDGCGLLVAVHHGAADGLGMVGLLGLLTGVPITCSARGIDKDAEPPRFWRRAVARVVEAFLRPPARLGPTGRTSDQDGDWTRVLPVTGWATGTVGLVGAVTRAGLAWRGRGRHRTVVSLALSTRPGRPQPTPDRATAYGRVVLSSGSDASAAEALRSMVPEPAFPATTAGGVGPLVTRMLGSRLGATVLVSNIGRLEGAGLLGAELWPAPSGPAGVAVGAVTAGEETTVSVRMRRGWFSDDETAEFTGLLARELAPGGAEPPGPPQ